MRSLRALAFATAAAACAATAGTARAGWWDGLAVARETTLAEVRDRPSRWIDVTVSVVARYVGPAPSPRPADFPVAKWRAFAAETDEAPEFRRLVVRRGSAEEASLDALRAGDDVRIRAVPRAAADLSAKDAADDAAPVLEVVWLSGPADPFSPEEAAVVARADDLLFRDNAPAAEALYRSVLDSRRFAPAIRADLLGKLGRACRHQRKFDEAVAAFREVARLVPDSGLEDEIARMESARKQDLGSVALLAPVERFFGPGSRNESPASDAPATEAPAAPSRAAPPNQPAPSKAAAAPAPPESDAPPAPPAAVPPEPPPVPPARLAQPK